MFSDPLLMLILGYFVTNCNHMLARICIDRLLSSDLPHV